MSPRKTVRRPRVVLEEEEEFRGGVENEAVGDDLDATSLPQSEKKTLILRKGADSQGMDSERVGEVRPPPPEAYIVLRPHRVPRVADFGGDVSGVGTGVGTAVGVGKGTGKGTKGKGKYGKSIGTGARKGNVDVGWDDGIPGDIPTFEKWYVPFCSPAQLV